jgi:hypothetical protein
LTAPSASKICHRWSRPSDAKSSINIFQAHMSQSQFQSRRAGILQYKGTCLPSIGVSKVLEVEDWSGISFLAFICFEFQMVIVTIGLMA